MTAQNGVNTALTRPGRVFPRPFTHGGICPPHMGEQVQGDKALMGENHEGGQTLWGDLTLIDYIINYKYCQC